MIWLIIHDTVKARGKALYVLGASSPRLLNWVPSWCCDANDSPMLNMTTIAQINMSPQEIFLAASRKEGLIFQEVITKTYRWFCIWKQWSICFTVSLIVTIYSNDLLLLFEIRQATLYRQRDKSENNKKHCTCGCVGWSHLFCKQDRH